MKVHEIDRKLWKPSDDKKPAWNRAKVYRGSKLIIKSFRHPHLEIHENLSKYVKIDEYRWKSVNSKENNESHQMTPAWNRAKVSIEAAGWLLSPLDIHTPKYMKNH